MSSDTWTPEMGVTKPMGENILRYLYQEGPTRKDQIEKVLPSEPRGLGPYFGFIEDHDYVELTYVGGGMDKEYELSEKGRDLVESL